MNRFLITLAAAAAASATAAFAQPPGGAPPLPPPGDASDTSTTDEGPLVPPAARLLAEARRLKEKEGCAAAAPTYRVVAGMGAGEEAAQHELGECLLLVDGVDATETALFRQEGVFWLTRAAYAGNARAQRALAVYNAPQTMGAGANEEALKWALVYGRNPDAAVYGYKEFPATFVPGLKAQLGPEKTGAAETFAAAFKPRTLARFEPPAPGRKDKRGERPTPPPQRPR